jgi:ribulose-phosphate 3-epimerase
LEVDGGVTTTNARAVRAAGASVLVAGSSVFSGGAGAYRDNIAALRRAADLVEV